MNKEEKVSAKLGIRVGAVFFIALSILIFAAYVAVSQSVQNMLTDYTLKLVQSIMEQGVATVEYELYVGRSKILELADSFSVMNGDQAAKSNILRMLQNMAWRLQINGRETLWTFSNIDSRI